jgi:hypothetical protein
MKSPVKPYLYSIIAVLVIIIFISIIYKSFNNDKETYNKTQDNNVKISCDSSLWEHVYQSHRFKVFEQCKIVTGYVELLRKEDDGNYHILLRLDEGESKLLNNANYAKQKGCLLLEPVCATTATKEEAMESCKDFVNKVYIPAKYKHIKATGSYVLDTENGGMAIHPVTKFEVIE